MKALSLSPNQPDLRRGAAESLVKLNRSAEASEQYRLIERKRFSDWVQLARLELMQQTKDLSFGSNQWESIQKLIDLAAESVKETNPPPLDYWMVDLLQAELDVRKTPPSMQREVIEVPVISEAIRRLGAPTSALVRAGGLEALLVRGQRGRKEGTCIGVEPAVITALAERLAANEFASAEQARRWLKKEHGIDRPYNTVWNWLKKLHGVLRVPRPSHSKKNPP
jgi:hypothetical protein